MHGCPKHVSGPMSFSISQILTHACDWTVGLGIDCSPWVEAGLITHAGMLDRNWALWATFCQVHLTPLHTCSSANITCQDTTWSLYVGREFCSFVNSQAIPVPFVTPDLDPFLGSWPPKDKEPPNHISGTFSATCSLMQIAREVADAVYV